MKLKSRFTIFSMMISIVFSGCAANIIKSGSSRSERLEFRINEYIAAKKSGDIVKEYEFFPPEYKKAISLVDFKEKQKPNKNISLSKINYTPDNDNARVEVKIDQFVMGVQLKDFEINQCWLYLEGDWYLFARPLNSMSSISEQCTTESYYKK